MEDGMRHLELEEERLHFSKLDTKVYMASSSFKVEKELSASIKVEISKLNKTQNLSRNQKKKKERQRSFQEEEKCYKSQVFQLWQ